MIQKFSEWLLENQKYDFGCVMVYFPLPNITKEVQDQLLPEDVYTEGEDYGHTCNDTSYHLDKPKSDFRNLHIRSSYL